MFLKAVAIYNCPEEKKPNEPKLINASTHETTALSLFPVPDPYLKVFQDETYPKLPEKVFEHHLPTESDPKSYHYIKKIPGDPFFMVLCSRQILLPKEIKYLFINLRHAQLRPNIVNINDMIKNPLAYNAKDHQITYMQNQVNEAKHVMCENIDQVITRGEHIEDLIVKSKGLVRQTEQFETQAKKLNRRCCF